MYNWDKNTCIHQDLGIGIPTPDWFKGNTSSLGELQYLQHNNTYYDVYFNFNFIFIYFQIFYSCENHF